MDMNDIEPIIAALPTSVVEATLLAPAQAIGNGLKDIIEIVFSPIKKANLYVDGKLKKFENKIKEEVEKIPVDRLDDSKNGLVLKALEDSRYSINEDIMQTLFAKLIAASVDKSKNQKITPNFSEILKKLSPDDAYVLLSLKSQTLWPIVGFEYQTESGASNKILKNHIIWSDNTFQDLNNIIPVLKSFGLINVDYENWLSSDIYLQKYDLISSEKLYMDYKNAMPKEYTIITPSKGYLEVTEYGHLFLSIVSP
ncbi:DUF4393 domain-containing protein [Periweissella fabaria]|uniref:DUF4393 domain-containing protein n=1 Tax=Periweissella fabaria TaxID=546157 RepID=A0ABM8Z403_9LACO|nr:DUF4393 domain-containing protein [Periweissella fabaria]MCM0596315.1 DUF4393 domain-containing protein [Periweissella fabaria]CAH0415929.1 hypothetical protein WFA24289_00227 [Periweissella fabaria]